MTALNVLLLRLFVTDLGHLSSPFKLLQLSHVTNSCQGASADWEQKREGDFAGAATPACAPLSEPHCQKHLCSQEQDSTWSSAHRTRFCTLGVGSSSRWHFTLSNTLSLQSSHHFPVHGTSRERMQKDAILLCHILFAPQMKRRRKDVVCYSSSLWDATGHIKIISHAWPSTLLLKVQ